MFYARTSEITARFYNRAARDEFCTDTGAEPVRSRAAKFVPGADSCITFGHKDRNGNWCRL